MKEGMDDSDEVVERSTQTNKKEDLDYGQYDADMIRAWS